MPVFNVQKRGKSKPSQLRRNGEVPMALVDRDHQTTMIQASADSLREALRHTDSHGRLELKLDGDKKSRKAIVKAFDQDPVRHELLHVTLQVVADDDQVKLDVPVIGHGSPIDAESPEVTLMQVTDHVKLRGKMSSMPERIEVDLSGLQAGHHIEAKDLDLPEGIDLISSPDATIFSMKVRSFAETTEEEVVAEPEAESEAEPAP